jgi:hypothetical protein
VDPRKIKYRPFEQAREFVRGLGLHSESEWRMYCRSELPDKSPKPDDVPYDPARVYRAKGWRGKGDWLGTGNVGPGKMIWRSFEQAKEFVHGLHLRSWDEWWQYSKGELTGKPSRPSDIPADPSTVYHAQGWSSWGDWLGTGNVKHGEEPWLPFERARAFVRRLGLRSQGEWRSYCKGELVSRGPKPDHIPSSPASVYRNKGWKGVGDWLGTDHVRNGSIEYRRFGLAREFVRGLRLRSWNEWWQYCRGELADREPRPNDIPAAPDNQYRGRGWTSWGDWFGTGSIQHGKEARLQFEPARQFVRRLGLRSQNDWNRYCKGELVEKEPRPNDIPLKPYRAYRNKGWISWGDWLGTGTIWTGSRRFRPFKQARLFVHGLRLRSSDEWRRYCRGELPDRDPKPEDIPTNPHRSYKTDGWKGIKDWLGT